MKFLFVTLFSCLALSTNAQFLMDMVDTSKEIGKSVLSVSQRFDHIRISGYMQPQFQLAQEKGAKTYIGGDFAPNSNNRIMLRRGRIRFDYIRFNK
ncbi:MAG: porin, partial [Ginsengibacter sp.]